MNPEEILERYNKLKENSKPLNNSIFNIKRAKISIFLSNLGINDSRVTNNLNVNISLYSAPVKKIYNSTFIYYYDSIYLDSDYISNLNNSDTINCQLTHEFLHSLGNDEDGKQYFFGHLVNQDYTGIDEATTQLFTEDIEQKYLNEQTDPNLYFIKNIMRILKVVIGSDVLIKQYLNIENTFESKINILMNNDEWLKQFALLMKQYYILKHKKENIEDLKLLEKKIISKIYEIIEKQKIYDKSIYEKIKKEFLIINSSFLEDYNIFMPNKSIKI